jgi:SAM-dependent methyltransferase
MTVPADWCKDFFGKHYMLGDNSIAGYLPGVKEDLRQRTQREAAGVVQLLELSSGDSILDVPCGYGRHSLLLAERGFRMTGLDINKDELEMARAAAEKAGLDVKFLERDMREVGKDLHGQFEAVINMFFAFGFFEEEEQNVRSMEEFYNSLKDGGRMLIHSDVSAEMLEKGTSYRLRETRHLETGCQLLIEEEFDRATRRLNGSWTMGDRTRPYSMRIYSAKEYEQMALACGFRQVAVYGSFAGERFTPESGEIIVVARK